MEAAQPAGPRPESRRGRWLVIVLLGFAAVSLLAAIQQLSTREGGTPRIELAGINDAQRIFGGLPSAGDRLGNADAPVVIQVFNDVQCSTCAEDFLEVIPPLVDEEVRSDEVQLLYRNYSFSINPVAEGFIANVAAGEQGYLWPYVYLQFRNQELAESLGGVDADFLDEIASSIKELEIEEWRRTYLRGGGPEGPITEELAEQDEIALGLGLRGEPSMIVTGPNGTETLQDSPTLARARAAIDRVE